MGKFLLECVAWPAWRLGFVTLVLGDARHDEKCAPPAPGFPQQASTSAPDQDGVVVLCGVLGLAWRHRLSAAERRPADRRFSFAPDLRSLVTSLAQPMCELCRSSVPGGLGHLTQGEALAPAVDGRLVVITGLLLGIDKIVAGVVGVGVAGALRTNKTSQGFSVSTRHWRRPRRESTLESCPCA